MKLFQENLAGRLSANTVGSHPWNPVPHLTATHPNRPVLPRIAAGDQGAVRELITNYGGLVWSLARHFTGSHSEAEDAVQDIFIYLWQKAGMYEPSIGSEDTFVSVLTRRRLIDRWRRESRRPRHEAISDHALGASGGQVRDDSEEGIARSLFEGLSEEERLVLRLSIAFGCTHQMIASQTGIPLGTVKTLIRRSLIQGRACFDTKVGRAST